MTTACAVRAPIREQCFPVGRGSFLVHSQALQQSRLIWSRDSLRTQLISRHSHPYLVIYERKILHVHLEKKNHLNGFLPGRAGQCGCGWRSVIRRVDTQPGQTVTNRPSNVWVCELERNIGQDNTCEGMGLRGAP